MRILPLLLLIGPILGLAGEYPINAATKKAHPAKPEDSGLRLEINARLDDSITSNGTGWKWDGAFLSIEIALRNTSQAPITVPTTLYDGKATIADWPGWGQGMERIRLNIKSPMFQGKPTAYAASRFSPVTLAPGECVLLLDHRTMIEDRKHADSIKEVSASFGVARDFSGPQEWWRGNLETYAEISRRNDPDKEIALLRASQERYTAQKEAEEKPGYGIKNSARIASLIASADNVRIRGELEKKEDEIVVRDLSWIRRVSEVIATTPLSESVACLCIGWNTAYFYKGEQLIVSVAAIHGNQLRIHCDGDSGDYPITEAHWSAVKAVLDRGVKAPTVPAEPKTAGKGHPD
ncbi:MAG: hypothetical protein HYX71_08540 [Opitutae bacterium]|nr:hypothetical protein [Opitutae bacterium]